MFIFMKKYFGNKIDVKRIKLRICTYESVIASEIIHLLPIYANINKILIFLHDTKN